MIKVVMTRTSDVWWYEIKTIPNLESLLAMQKSEGHYLIIKENVYYREDPEKMVQYMEISLEKAKEISEIEIEIEIYDDYRE